MHVGVVGTGIAGLTAAWLFKQAGAEVTVFEKQARLGMDAHGVEFEIDGIAFRTDVPPRMFNEPLWPNLSRLYREIGVSAVPVEPSKSFVRRDHGLKSGSDSGSVLLKLGASYQPKLSPQLLLNSATRQILNDVSKMLSEAPKALEQPFEMKMGDYLRVNGYSSAFVYQFLYPALSSTVCTCSYATLDAYPADILLAAMLKLTRPEGLFRTRHGTREVVRLLTLGLDDIRLEASVTNIVASQFDTTVSVSTGECFKFDHVIVATQANAARRLLDSAMEPEDRMLSHFGYENVPVVVHTDRNLMPHHVRDWSHFNLISDVQRHQAMCSIWMNRFCPEWQTDSPVFQTIMPFQDPQPESVIGVANMQRPFVDQTSLDGLDLMDQLHSESGRRVWFCGSYASRGIPLLESGVVSSLNVAARVGIRWPDKCSVEAS